VPNLVPTILVRKEAFLVNILHLRALVKADEILLFDTYGSADSRLHSVFLYHLEHNLKSASSALPYEFRALESILLSVLSALEAEVVLLRNTVGGLLAALEDDIDRDKFMYLLHAARRLAAFQNRARLVQRALEEVLEQDEDLQAMHLSAQRAARAAHPAEPDPAFDVDHSELEVLLESFEKQVAEVANEAEGIQANVAATQEIVELVLDANRNALLALDLRVSIGTMGLGVGALLAGLFGMNLPNHLEEDPWAFAAVALVSALASAAVAGSGLRRLAKIRKVGLSSTHPAQVAGIALPRPSLRERRWVHRDRT
jgi:magnesium transporter